MLIPSWTWSFCLAVLLTWLSIPAAVSAAEPDDPPLVLQEDFENGAERWYPTDPNVWKLSQGKDGQGLGNWKQGNYRPRHRSPWDYAILRDVYVGDFVLEADVRSAVKDYGHRDMCLFFGYQNATQFYYVHLGKQTDDHANQIFIVNEAPRTKISTKTTDGTAWTDEWHHVKVVRRVEDGTIEVYFDDMETPVMTAQDKTFTWGQIGVGTFDDQGAWDNIVLRGVKVEKP